MQALEALNVALKREIDGQEYYNRAAVEAGNEKGSIFFKWLAREENGHIKLLNEAINTLTKHQSWPERKDWDSKYLSEPISVTEFPSKPEVMGQLPAHAPELKIFEKAIEAEKNDADFYKALAEKVDDLEGKRMLEKLALIERGHATALEEQYKWMKYAQDMFTVHRFNVPTC